jgi:hypothetical protein
VNICFYASFSVAGGICSFDQWGVELGKALASNVRGALKAYRSDGDAASPLSGFNPSTAALLERYVKHVDPRY